MKALKYARPASSAIIKRARRSQRALRRAKWPGYQQNAPPEAMKGEYHAYQAHKCPGRAPAPIAAHTSVCKIVPAEKARPSPGKNQRKSAYLAAFFNYVLQVIARFRSTRARAKPSISSPYAVAAPISSACPRKRNISSRGACRQQNATIYLSGNSVERKQIICFGRERNVASVGRGA